MRDVFIRFSSELWANFSQPLLTLCHSRCILASQVNINQITFLFSECPQIIVQIHEDGNSVTCKVERSNHDGCIHWFHGTVNLTSQSTQDIYSAVDGSYTVISSLNVSSNWKTYNCSYWVPQIEQYIASKNIVMKHTKSNTQSFNSGRRPDLVFCLCLLWMLIQQ